LSRKINIELAERVKNLPPYLFAAIDRMKQEAISKGVDLIDLSIGDPDIATPRHIVEKMKVAVENPRNHRYPSYAGMPSFREAVRDWYKMRFGVSLNADSEVISLIGSKEGIGHIPLAFINTGDVALIPSPGYPVYSVATIFAGGESYTMPLLKENHFIPALKAIPPDILKRARLMFINYPNNPTSAIVQKGFFEEVVEFAFKHNIIVCHDAAYSEIYYDDYKPLSFLQIPGAIDVGMEFHSLSKTYNMTGWRIGFAAGNSKVLAGLGKIKTNLDSGVFQAIQEAAIEAFKTDDTILKRIRDTYRKRRDVLFDGLLSLGLELEKPKATFYMWGNVPNGFNSTSFVAHMLDKAGILATPGNGFGTPGEGYVRFAITAPLERIKEAVERLKKIL